MLPPISAATFLSSPVILLFHLIYIDRWTFFHSNGKYYHGNKETEKEKEKKQITIDRNIFVEFVMSIVQCSMFNIHSHRKTHLEPIKMKFCTFPSTDRN